RQCVANPLLHRRNELAGDDAADDAIDELEPRAARQRRHLDPGVAELPAPPRLFLQAALRFGSALDRFLVRDLRRFQLDVDAELALQLLDRDLDVQLADA